MEHQHVAVDRWWVFQVNAMRLINRPSPNPRTGTLQNGHGPGHPAAAMQAGRIRVAEGHIGKRPVEHTFRPKDVISTVHSLFRTAAAGSAVEGHAVHAPGHAVALGLGGQHQRPPSRPRPGHVRLVSRAARLGQSAADVPVPAHRHGVLDARPR